MSDTRTSNVPDVSNYVVNLSIVSDLAVAAGNRLSRSLSDDYCHQQACLKLRLSTNMSEAGGFETELQSETIFISGWKLYTAPYFLSEPSEKFNSAVFITSEQYRADKICPEFLDFREKGLSLLPTLAQLKDIQEELTRILI